MTHLQSLLNAADKAAVAEANFGKLDTHLRKASAVLDFVSLAAQASQDLTIAVVGAVVGDGVLLGLPAAPNAGVVFTAWVSAAGVVTVRATNITGAAIDPASMAFNVMVVAS
jgi:hypothetical protein